MGKVHRTANKTLIELENERYEDLVVDVSRAKDLLQDYLEYVNHESVFGGDCEENLAEILAYNLERWHDELYEET